MESLAYLDQKKETVHEIREESQGERIEMHNHLAAVNERFQVSRCQDPGWLNGNNE